MEFLHFILEEEGSVFVGAQIINKSKEFVPFETMLAFIAFDEDVACVQIWYSITITNRFTEPGERPLIIPLEKLSLVICNT